MSCPVTPGGVLKKNLSNVINKNKVYQTQVIEDGGKPVHCGLRVKDPLRPHGCVFGDQNCIVRGDQQCDRMGVVYRIMCTKCLEEKPENENHKYIGMTRTSVHNRMLGHLRDQSSKLAKCPLYRHDIDVHNGVPQIYVTNIVASEIQ